MKVLTGRVFVWACALIATLTAISLLTDRVVAQADLQLPNLDVYINNLNSPDASSRENAAKYLIDNWKKGGLARLIEALRVTGRALQERQAGLDLTILIPVTDVLRTIVVNKDDAIYQFRVLNNDDNRGASRALIAAARSSDKNLRINATYILANVADNRDLCIIMDNLRDKNLTADGRVNLLQIALPVSGYAYRENFRWTNETIEMLNSYLLNSKDDVSLTKALLDSLSRNIAKSGNRDKPLPDYLPFCKTYQFEHPYKKE